MSNEKKKKSSPESSYELYINQQVIKGKVWLKILHSGSCPDLFICWNTSKRISWNFCLHSQHLTFIILKNDIIWRLFISKCQWLWFSHHPLKYHHPFLWCSRHLQHLMPSPRLWTNQESERELLVVPKGTPKRLVLSAGSGQEAGQGILPATKMPI